MILKYTIREARPLQREINYTEFGMVCMQFNQRSLRLYDFCIPRFSQPSSHSQLMWYFAAYSVYFALFRLTLHFISTK